MISKEFAVIRFHDHLTGRTMTREYFRSNKFTSCGIMGQWTEFCTYELQSDGGKCFDNPE